MKNEFLRLMEILKDFPNNDWKEIFNNRANNWFDMAMDSQDDATYERYMTRYYLSSAFAELCVTDFNFGMLDEFVEYLKNKE